MWFFLIAGILMGIVGTLLFDQVFGRLDVDGDLYVIDDNGKADEYEWYVEVYPDFDVTKNRYVIFEVKRNKKRKGEQK